MKNKTKQKQKQTNKQKVGFDQNVTQSCFLELLFLGKLYNVDPMGPLSNSSHAAHSSNQSCRVEHPVPKNITNGWKIVYNFRQNSGLFRIKQQLGAVHKH